jgi:UDP-4-amino-4,6-dideoxy-N-acetyl-beta-L-altrosamine transaminase
MIPYGRQEITQADLDAVMEVLRSDTLTQGPQVPAFEAKVARDVGAQYAVAVNSATSALHLACLALQLGPGDWLWTSPISFVASANCAIYCGAQVDFVDIDPRTYNLCPKALEDKLKVAAKAGRLPKVVVPVHMCGQPCDMAAIHALGQQYGFRIIEDASHALGARYAGAPIGNCRFSDITVFSFHPVKIITTAEGGMALTQSAELAQKMALLRSHGITRDAARMTQPPDGPWYYQQLGLGYNYRMNELQGALGLSQLQRLPTFISRRQMLAERYATTLKALPLTLPGQRPDDQSAWHLFVVRLALDAIRPSHREVFETLRSREIGVNLHYIPIHTQPYYQRMGFRWGDFPEAERYYAEALSLPMYPGLTECEQDHVVSVLHEVLA